MTIHMTPSLWYVVIVMSLIVLVPTVVLAVAERYGWDDADGPYDDDHDTSDHTEGPRR